VTELACLPYGIGSDSEGVCLGIRMGPYRILLDCGRTDLTPLDPPDSGQKPTSNESPADLVLCSHAHSDHAQGLWELHRRFPHLPIYTSEATTHLVPLNWLDVADAVPTFCQALPWRSPIEVMPHLTVELFPAGHLPGAAAFLLTYTGGSSSNSPMEKFRQRPYSVFYTGDFFLSNARLVNGLSLEALRGLKPDVLIIEGSYGTARHPRRRHQENQLAELIDRAIAQSHSVLLPTPTLGPGQELLTLLRSHNNFTGRDIDIWVDPTIAAGCDAYLSLLPHLPSSVQNFARHQPLFWDERVRPHVRRQPPLKDLPSIFATGKPCIVLAHRDADLSPYLTDSPLPWVLLLPQQPGELDSIAARLAGYQAASPALEAALQREHLILDTYLLGEHCDGPSTTQLIHNLRPQHVVLVHGPSNYLADLANLEELQNRYQLHIPTPGVMMELPVGETFIQPAPPDAAYEGELLDTEAGVMLQLPHTLTADPRWHQFSDTGVIEARWQGEELVIRSVVQRELLHRTQVAAIAPDLDCCQTCQYCRGHRCCNAASPLYGFRVSLDGYCPAFESVTPKNIAALEDEWEERDRPPAS